ncbi:MAG: hypothetical protein KJ593_07955 [Candidatus Omnitrophica bacterium]|nr:hypothetical protein [Candidatus Omnitrophota bacterium]
MSDSVAQVGSTKGIFKIRKHKKRKPEAREKNLSLILLLVFSLLFLVGFDFLKSGLPAKPKVRIAKTKEGDYQLLTRSVPFVIKGVCYSPVPIGKNYSYDFWQQDLEVFKKDAQLMQDMGVNAIRIYQPGPDIERTKEIINYFYEEFGIRTIMGHWIGFWQGTYPDYDNSEFRQSVKRDCLAMVNELKDTEGILLWVLGNENNFSFGKQRLRLWSSLRLDEIKDPYKKRQAKAKVYYKFINEIAACIKDIDPDHPVALGNGGIDFIETAKEHSSHVDILACSIYSGKSFGRLFSRVKDLWGKAFFISEFGSDSFNAHTKQPDEDMQTQFIISEWKEIERNLAGASGEGNCLGGVVFEWTDEWWKTEEYNPQKWSIHDETAGWSNGAYYFDIAAEGNLNMNEEWWGIVRLVAEDGPDERIPKKVYYALEEYWSRD